MVFILFLFSMVIAYLSYQKSRLRALSPTFWISFMFAGWAFIYCITFYYMISDISITTCLLIFAYISGEKKTEAETIAQYQKSKNPPREKAISARVNGEIYDRFRTICEQKNMTTNAGLNMLIAEYVRQNEE